MVEELHLLAGWTGGNFILLSLSLLSSFLFFFWDSYLITSNPYHSIFLILSLFSSFVQRTMDVSISFFLYSDYFLQSLSLDLRSHVNHKIVYPSMSIALAIDLARRMVQNSTFRFFYNPTIIYPRDFSFLTSFPSP